MEPKPAADNPIANTSATVVFDFPHHNRANDQRVRATVAIRWEDDPDVGLGTVWWARFDHPPYRLDNEHDGLIPQQAIIDEAMNAHRAAEPPLPIGG